MAVLADDLIWASRLVAAVERGGAQPTPARSARELQAVLDDAALRGEPAVDAVVVDLNGRQYDGVGAVRAAAERGVTVIAVGQHEDQPLRRRALDAGARRVYSYNKLFRDGPDVIRALLEAPA